MVQTTNYELTTDIESSQLPTVSPVEVGLATLSSHAINMDYLGSIGSGIQNKLNATIAPTATDDSGDGYSVTSVWADVTNDKIYTCIDATVGAAIWLEYGGPFIGFTEIPIGLVNGINADFTITATPIDGTLLVKRNGLAVPTSEFSFVHPVISFVTPPAIAQKIEVSYLTSGVSATRILTLTNEIIENILVTAPQVAAKKLVLANSPAVITEVKCDMRSGSIQIYGVDFNVINGNELNWNGFALDGVVIAGSYLRISYFI